MTAGTGDKLTELRALVQQIAVAAAPRRAAVLHLDRLPAQLPRRQRQAFSDIAGALAAADRAQHFLLPRGALAIVWRSHGEDELRPILIRAQALLDDLPRQSAPPLGALLTIYDLPEQGAALLEAMDEPPDPKRLLDAEALTLAMVPRLEAALVQADLTVALRRRPVAELGTGDIWRPAWDMLQVSVRDLLATLLPGPPPRLDGPLGAWLSRCVRRRTLAHFTGPRALEDGGPFCLGLTTQTILSPLFAAFDHALPARLRGALILGLRGADILQDGNAFRRARQIARAGQYRILLEDGDSALLDPDALGLDLVQRRCTGREEDLPAARDRILLSGVDTREQRDWAVAHGCRRITGLAAA